MNAQLPAYLMWKGELFALILKTLSEAGPPEPHKWLRKVEGVQGNWYRLHVGRDGVAVGELEGAVFHVLNIEAKITEASNADRLILTTPRSRCP